MHPIFANSAPRQGTIRLAIFQAKRKSACKWIGLYFRWRYAHLMSLKFQSWLGYNVIHQFLAIPDNLIKCLINFYSIFSHFRTKLPFSHHQSYSIHLYISLNFTSAWNYFDSDCTLQSMYFDCILPHLQSGLVLSHTLPLSPLPSSSRLFHNL